jgi:hypothetical protein
VDQIAHQLLGGIERKPVHRSRHVEYEDVFARRYIVGSDRSRRLCHHEKEVLVLALVEEEPSAHLVAGQAVAKDEVAVTAENLRRRQRHLGPARTVPVRQHLVGRAIDVLERHTRRQLGR